MATRIFGSGIRRREDPRLLTGTATYTDDISLPGMLHAVLLRSPHAHARITRIATEAAQAAPGVHAVYTGADVEDALQPMPCAWLLPDSDLKVASYPVIAKDIVRCTGDTVAVVVAESRYQAYDALDLIEVDYEPLDVVIDPEAAAKDGAPQLHPDVPGNQAFHWVVEGGDVDAAFANAEVVVTRAHPAAAPHPERHGAAVGGGAVRPGVGRAHAVGHHAEPAHRQVPVLGGHRDPGGQAPGDRPGGRRGLREQDSGRAG